MWDRLYLDDVREIDGDLAETGWEAEVRSFGPAVVLHLAAQAFVPLGFREPLRTFLSNTLGTARVLELVTDLETVETCLVVTTDKVYDSRQRPPHSEDDFLGGLDPYSASKAAAELVVAAWPQGKARVATARAGNVIGGGDSSIDRLVPDLLANWSAGRPVPLRSPTAIRPWQHVLQPLHGYLIYAERLASDPSVPRALNFGPDTAQRVQVLDMVSAAAELWEASAQPLPDPRYVVVPQPAVVETERLEIDSARAGQILGWRNTLDWRTSLKWAIEWELLVAAGIPANDIVDRQLARYESLVNQS
jgi:CDP-glucose 4,6-dehydratase